jgi:uncharacterized membrane protein YbhN (UPF0104 family)
MLRPAAWAAEARTVNKLVRRVLLFTLVGVVMYGLFAVYTGLSKIGTSLSSFHWSALGVALALATFNYLLRFAKWQFYLARLEIRGIPVLDSLLIFLTGFVLTITPGKVGEVFKSAVLAKTHGVPIERTAPIVIADRLTDVIGIAVLILAGGAAFPAGRPWALAGGVSVAVGLVFILWQRPAHWLCDRLEAMGGRAARPVPMLRAALSSLRLLASPSALPIPAVLSLVGWGAEGLALYVLLGGFGTSASLSLAVIVYSSATLAGALIPVPGGLGVVEGLLQKGLVQWGHIEHGTATAAMILVRLSTLWWAVVVGFIALFLLRLRFPGALASSDAGRADAAEPGIG